MDFDSFLKSEGIGQKELDELFHYSCALFLKLQVFLMGGGVPVQPNDIDPLSHIDRCARWAVPARFVPPNSIRICSNYLPGLGQGKTHFQPRLFEPCGIQRSLTVLFSLRPHKFDEFPDGPGFLWGQVAFLPPERQLGDGLDERHVFFVGGFGVGFGGFRFFLLGRSRLWFFVFSEEPRKRPVVNLTAQFEHRFRRLNFPFFVAPNGVQPNANLYGRCFEGETPMEPGLFKSVAENSHNNKITIFYFNFYVKLNYLTIASTIDRIRQNNLFYVREKIVWL